MCGGFGSGGGQTEWRWVGRDGLLGRFIRERNDRCCLVLSRTHPVRCAGLGRKGRYGRVSQAVRPASKRLRETADAKGVVAVRQYVTDGRAPGIAAEMAGKVVGFLTPLGPPKGGNHPSNGACICRTLQRKARRRGGFIKVIGYGLLVIEWGCSERRWVMVLPPRRNAQIIMKNTANPPQRILTPFFRVLPVFHC